MELEEFVRTFDINTIKSASQFINTVCNMLVQEEDLDEFKSLVYDIVNKTSGKKEFRTGLDETLREAASEYNIIFSMYSSVFKDSKIENDVPNWENYIVEYYFKLIEEIYNKLLGEFKKIDETVLPNNVVLHIKDSK